MTPPYRSPDKKQIPHFYRFHGPEQFHKVSLFYFFFSSTLPPVSKGRVLIVTYVFPPEEGGVGMAAYEMACSLSSLDWDIHVLTRPLDSPEEPFRSRPYSPLTTLPDTLTKNSARLREYLDGFLKDFRPDVIIYHSWADWCREELLDAARDSGIPFFLRSHGAATNFRSFFRFNYPPFFGLKKLLTLPPFFQSMPTKRLRPVLAIAADLPLGRLLTSFRNKDRRTIPWIFSLFHALESQEDFDIHWITLSKAVSAAETIRMRNQTIHILPLGSMGRNILTAHFLTVRRIRKTLNDIQPDLLHVWGVEQAYALAGITFRGKKLLSYQGALTAYCQRAPQAFLLHMQALWERMAVKHYDFITCESPWACDRVAEIAPHARLSCMEYGVEPSFYHLVRKPSPEPSCLFAGTIYELKGISYLVEAFTHPSLSHVQLFIAGNGALRERLEALSTPNIHWLGSISRAELQQRLSTAWFLVHPTLGDCCPNIVKEARVMGLPVITTEEGGQTQYVQDGVSGYIVPVRNSAAVREAAQKLSVSLDKAMSMGMERHQECRRLLDVKQTVTGCLSRYHTMLYSR